MAISNVTDWDEIEADPDFPSLSQESRAKLFDDWEKKFSRTLLEGADLDKVKPEGLNRLAATNAVRRRKLAGEDVSDLNVAAKTWSEQKQAEAKLAQQALKDYADVEDKKFRLDDARSMPGVDELGRAAPWWEEGVAKATKDLESAEAKLVPEVRAQAQAASEALKGKRKIATLNGNIYTDPALVLDKDEFRQQVLDSDAPPEAKALKLASFQNEKKRYLDEAINTLTKGDPQIPLAESFPKFLEAKGFDLDQEMVKQSEGKLDYSPIQKQRELAQEYLTKMQDRGWFRKIGSALSTGVASGMLDIGTQAVGTAAMLTGDEEKSKVAAELSRASGDIGAAQGLEGDMQATGGTFAGGVSRLGTNMAPMLLPGGAVGGIARLAGAGAGAATAAAVGASALTAGAQTAGSQFGEVYDHLRQQGSTHEQAFGVSRNAAVLSGAVTTALTALGGATGVESLLRQGGKELVKSRLVAALKAVPGGAAKEIAEELPDEYVSQLVSAFAKDPNASPSQVTDEFAANAPDLILQIAALGGAGSGVGRFKETTTDPTKTAQEQEFPAAGAPPDLSQRDRDNFAQGGVPIFDTEGNVTGYTAPRAAEATASTEDIRKAAEEAIKPGIPVEVEGVTIATIPPGSDMTPDEVLDFANSPDDMAMLARNGKITLPEVVAPIEGVDPAITDEMNAQFAKGRADGLANETLDELERQKAAQTADTEVDIPEAQVAPTVGETAAPEVDISEESLQREWQKLEDRALAAIEFGATDRVPAIRDEQASISKRLLDARTKEVKPAETLGVTPPPAPALEAPEGAARNAEMLRQAAARAAGTEQGPRIGFINPSVKLDLTPEESGATGAGMKEENKQTPRDTSKAERLKYLKSREVNTSGGTSLSDAEDEELAELTGQFPPTYRDPSKPEQMLPREVEKAAVEKKLSEGVGARLKGANKKSYVLGVEAGARREHRSAIADAFDDNKPVSTEAVDTYGIELPEGYARQGELYIFQPSSEKSDLGAGAATTPAKGPLKVTTPKAGKPTELELKAAAIGDDPAALKKRLNEAKSVLSNLAKKKMGAGKLDLENKRLIADDGSFALQWRVRRSPSEPISYENQQTSIGVVFATPVEKQVSPVTTTNETPSNAANAAGGSQSVQTEPAEGSIPTVTEDTVSISDIPSTAEIQPEVRENPTPEEKAELEELDSLMERRGQAQNKVKGATFSKKDEARFQELGAKLRRFLFETVDAANDAVVGEDINGQPIRQSKNGTLYTVENGRVRTAPAFKPDPEYSRQQDELLAKQKASPAVEESVALDALPDNASLQTVQSAAPSATRQAALMAVSSKSKTDWLAWLKSRFSDLVRFADALWTHARSLLVASLGFSPALSDLTEPSASTDWDRDVAAAAAVAWHEPAYTVKEGVGDAPRIETASEISVPALSSMPSNPAILDLDVVTVPQQMSPETTAGPARTPRERTALLSAKTEGSKATRLPSKLARWWLARGQSPVVAAGARLLNEQEATSAEIKALLKSLGVAESADTFPWCASFVSWALNRAGVPQRTLSARSFLGMGRRVSSPSFGDVAVLWNENPATGGKDGWGGHAGLYLGETENQVILLSGNANDEVNVSAFPKDRVLGYRSFNDETPALRTTEEWSPAVNEPASFTAANGQKLVGTVQSVAGGKAIVRFPWNGKEITQAVPVSQLSRPVASLTEPPSYQYTQEQNTRKAGKHFPTTPGVHANHDFRKSFASMAEDTSLSRIYRQIAKVMSKMDAFANIDLHIVADGDIGYAGEYSHSNGKSSIAVNLRQVARGKVDALGTILHEALHHITLAKVRNPQGAFETEVVPNSTPSANG
jgi:uncharacterized protein (TIGR02594 family)